MDTKQKILDEALTLFSEKGYANVFVSEIAERVVFAERTRHLGEEPVAFDDESFRVDHDDARGDVLDERVGSALEVLL